MGLSRISFQIPVSKTTSSAYFDDIGVKCEASGMDLISFQALLLWKTFKNTYRHICHSSVFLELMPLYQPSSEHRIGEYIERVEP